MALKRSGSASNLTFLITAFWAIAMIIILVGGHLVFAFLLYYNFTDNEGMKVIATFTGLPTWLLWLSIITAFALDVWIIYHKRQDRIKALKR